jgi:hypothetical protein
MHLFERLIVHGDQLSPILAKAVDRRLSTSIGNQHVTFAISKTIGILFETALITGHFHSKLLTAEI